MSHKINKYPDGTSYINLDLGSILGNKDRLETIFKINSYEDLWHLNQFSDCLRGTKCTVIIPNLLDAQADRRFSPNQSSGLKLVCDLLNSMTNLEFEVFHPHNPEVVEALLDRVEIIDNSEFIKQVIANLAFNSHIENPDKKFIMDTILMSSDAGGFKPLMKLCDKIDWRGGTYSASKYRHPGPTIDGGSKLVQTVDKEDFKGKDILIIDDISVYGGTFKGLAKLLRERNVGKLYLAVSHMTVQNLGDDPVTDYFDKVFVTNSKYNEYYGKSGLKPKNLEIIELW